MRRPWTLAALALVLLATCLAAGVPSASAIDPFPTTGLAPIASGLTYHAIAHEVFQLVEDAMVPDVDPWLETGTAEWAATRASAAEGGTEANPDRTLDCVGSECGDTEYDKNGYPGWMLFEYLAERYGDTKVKDVWDH